MAKLCYGRLAARLHLSDNTFGCEFCFAVAFRAFWVETKTTRLEAG
jgi:hypothetical protein